MKNRQLACFSKLCSLFFLSSCASQELRTAPQRSDQAWQPTVNAQNVIIPQHSRQHTLLMPQEYSLPANKDIQIRPASAVENAHNFTLPELIDLAQSNNPQTKIAWEEAKNAALSVGITKSTYLPQLTATIVGGYTHRKNQGNSITSASAHGEIQTLGMQWLLFDFGRKEALIKAAREDQIASNIMFTQEHQKIIYNVTVSFYSYLSNKAHIALLQTALNNAKKIEKAAQAKLKYGQGTITDLLQSQQLIAQSEVRLVQAQGALNNAYITLINNIGISPKSHIAIEDIQKHDLDTHTIHLTDNIIQEYLEQRPDVLAAYAKVKSAQSRVKAAQKEFLPKIFLSGNMAYSTGRLGLSSAPSVGSNSSPTYNLSTNSFSGIILGGVTVPIFDGGLRSATLKQAKNMSDSSEASLQQTVDNSVKQIIVSENSLSTSLSAYSASEKLEKTSLSSFDASLISYQNNIGSIVQLAMAQNSLIDAEMNESDAYYASLIAATDLAFASGSLTNDQPIDKNLPPKGL
ncbi:TolC family protein [Swingsia samuiensis]|uniref:Protein CyaE n=1 Tax=Swingsia samuiensis TaxID=1293412 RepID=A0A4Y6UHV0_9PROT|nr:TolC family protein [Swingsia samuiensis]QDH17179.1 TolC family protein [Swingsia samuiensis]